MFFFEDGKEKVDLGEGKVGGSLLGRRGWGFGVDRPSFLALSSVDQVYGEDDTQEEKRSRGDQDDEEGHGK